MATTSERLNEIISIRNIKQVEIIEKTGISKGALSSYLSGRYVPKQDNIYKLAKCLDVNPAWLMGIDCPMELEPAAPSSLRRDEVELLNLYNSLNAAGKKEVHKYINMVADRDEYKLKGDASEHSVSAVG